MHLINNMHLTMRNIRGSVAYWYRVRSELIAKCRCLRLPTWFLTFSCNDLNWIDMLIALPVADVRDANEVDVESISFSNWLSSVEQYPVVVSRQFTVRLNAFIRFLRSNPNVLGSLLKTVGVKLNFKTEKTPFTHACLVCECTRFRYRGRTCRH